MAKGGSDVNLHFAVVTDTATFVPGDYVYIKNKDDYPTWAPSGFWQGENCLCMGMNAAKEATFGGLGGQETNRKTESQLRQVMKDHYEQDCAPHTVTNPVVEIRFTSRSRILTGD